MGCILAELLGGVPFFKGRDYVDQLNKILQYLGTPNEETLSRIGSPRAQDYVRSLNYMPKKKFESPLATEDAKDLLDKMLTFDPSSRITVEEALAHPYLGIWHDSSDEPECPTTFDFHFEVVDDVPKMKKMILEEVQRFREYIRQPRPEHPVPHSNQVDNVPIPANVPIPPNASQWRKGEPRPEEVTHGEGWENEVPRY